MRWKIGHVKLIIKAKLDWYTGMSIGICYHSFFYSTNFIGGNVIDAAGTVKGSGVWSVSMLSTPLMKLCTV